jgi:hypothetical protein
MSRAKTANHDPFVFYELADLVLGFYALKVTVPS